MFVNILPPTLKQLIEFSTTLYTKRICDFKIFHMYEVSFIGQITFIHCTILHFKIISKNFYIFKIKVTFSIPYKVFTFIESCLREEEHFKNFSNWLKLHLVIQFFCLILMCPKILFEFYILNDFSFKNVYF